MKFIPILYSTPMVKSIRNGSKDRTRRVIKEAAGYNHDWKVVPVNEEHADGIQRWEMRNGTLYSLPWFKCPYGQMGDVLWVRETFSPVLNKERCPYDINFWYKADGEYPDYPNSFYFDKWKPSIFMPKDACRIFLQIINIRAERLQDITHADAILEGIEDEGCFAGAYWYKNYLLPDNSDQVADNAKHSFNTLWQSINGPDSWDKNPFVWVIEFKVIDKPENFL